MIPLSDGSHILDLDVSQVLYRQQVGKKYAHGNGRDQIHKDRQTQNQIH